jgi:protein-tyrosine phosphatase
MYGYISTRFPTFCMNLPSAIRSLRLPFTQSAAPAVKPPFYDIHNHVLPSVDDGAGSWDVALEMCRVAAADGVTHIVATPHANERYAYDREAHADRLRELSERVPGIQFTLGCDLNCSFDNVQDALRHPERYTIGGTRYVLLEFDAFAAPRHIVQVLKGLHEIDLVCIVTHPERLPLLTQFPQFVAELVEAGGLIQITANSLTGGWGRRVQRSAEHMLRRGWVSVIASDAHDPMKRAPVLTAAWKIARRFVGAEEADLLVSGRPGAILRNELLVPIPVAS